LIIYENIEILQFSVYILQFSLSAVLGDFSLFGHTLLNRKLIHMFFFRQ